MLALGAATAAVAAGELDFFTLLSGSKQFHHAQGESEYDRQGATRELEVTVTGISRLAGKQVTVYVSGKRVGTMRVSTRGRAHREWSTAHRQSVPLAGTGSTVRVRTSGGTLIVSGTYHHDRG